MGLGSGVGPAKVPRPRQKKRPGGVPAGVAQVQGVGGTRRAKEMGGTMAAPLGLNGWVLPRFHKFRRNDARLKLRRMFPRNGNRAESTAVKVKDD